jgi:hypothetical protein
MPIFKDTITPNGATVGFHVLKDAVHAFGNTHATVRVASWPSEADYLAGKGFVWMWELMLPVSSLPAAESALIAEGVLAGGSVVQDAAVGIEGARVRKWAEMKAIRQAIFDAPLVTPYGTFDSDARGREGIKEAVLLANNLTALGLDTPIRFTLADDTRPEFTAAEIVQVGLLLAQKVQGAYDTGDTLRQAIDAAATIEAVNAITWP